MTGWPHRVDPPDQGSADFQHLQEEDDSLPPTPPPFLVPDSLPVC